MKELVEEIGRFAIEAEVADEAAARKAVGEQADALCYGRAHCCAEHSGSAAYGAVLRRSLRRVAYPPQRELLQVARRDSYVLAAPPSGQRGRDRAHGLRRQATGHGLDRRRVHRYEVLHSHYQRGPEA